MTTKMKTETKILLGNEAVLELYDKVTELEHEAMCDRKELNRDLANEVTRLENKINDLQYEFKQLERLFGSLTRSVIKAE